MRAHTRLLGDYNAANCLAAVAVGVSQGTRFADAVSALESFPGVPGRMEQIDEGQPYRVIVDIASTEPAMRNVLRALRPSTDGKLIVVFGAAGERDVARRSGIAGAVAESADFAVIANEDPRSEDGDAIIDEIARALTAAGFAEDRNFIREPDRRHALRLSSVRRPAIRCCSPERAPNSRSSSVRRITRGTSGEWRGSCYERSASYNNGSSWSRRRKLVII